MHADEAYLLLSVSRETLQTEGLATMAIRSGTFETGHTAQIFIFPMRERMSALASREQKFAAMEAAARNHPVSSACDAWYHDEAVQDDLLRSGPKSN
jgi:hypothetical protein